MKILYLITKSNWGGAQRHVFDLAVHSKKIGHEVVVALGGEGVLKDKLEKADIPTRSVLEMWRDMSVSKDVISLIKIFKILREEKPDILHLHSPKAAGLGSCIGRLLGIKKIIYTVHGFAFNENRPWYQKVAIAFFSWITMLFSTHVITIYEKERQKTSRFPFIKDKLYMIHLGIHSPVFMSKGSIESFLKSKVPGTDEERIIIGTIAELHPNKGLVYAIDAMKKLVTLFPTVVFLVIGGGDQKNELEALIKEKGLEKNVILAGYVENAVQYLKAFSIFLLPSIKEGFPYCLLEAGHAGLPVVATTVGGIPEIIEDMKSGILIQPKKPDEIFHALDFLIRHKNVQKEYGKGLQEKVRSVFTIEKMLEATAKLYS